jgi:glycosyltransferase involved in cell wall biosynthesis
MPLISHSKLAASNTTASVGADTMAKRQNRILHVITESGPYGGAQRNTFLTVRGLIEDGYDTELICGPGGPLIQEARAAGVPVYVMADLVRPVHPVKDCRALVQLYRLFRSRRYHIVHTHSVKAGLLGRLAAWCARVPVIIHTLHGVPFRISGDFKSRFYILYERLLGLITRCFVCVGEVLRQEISAWKIAPEKKLTTIYSGIDFTSYVPQYTALETKQKLGAEGAWPIVGCIGRLSEQKAQHYLVEAAALLTDKYPQIKLLLVGEGGLRSFLEKQIQDLGLSSNVVLLGERDDIADLLNVFDVYAMSSRWEGVGRALTEAMHMGLPVVATSVDGVTELISDEKTGLLVPPQNPRSLAAAIDRLSVDRELAKSLGASARQRVKDLMDGQQMVRAIEELYEKLSERPASPLSNFSQVKIP